MKNNDIYYRKYLKYKKKYLILQKGSGNEKEYPLIAKYIPELFTKMKNNLKSIEDLLTNNLVIDLIKITDNKNIILNMKYYYSIIVIDVFDLILNTNFEFVKKEFSILFRDVNNINYQGIRYFTKALFNDDKKLEQQIKDNAIQIKEIIEDLILSDNIFDMWIFDILLSDSFLLLKQKFPEIITRENILDFKFQKSIEFINDSNINKIIEYKELILKNIDEMDNIVKFITSNGINLINKYFNKLLLENNLLKYLNEILKFSILLHETDTPNMNFELKPKKYKIETKLNLYNNTPFILEPKKIKKWIDSQCSINAKRIAQFIIAITRRVSYEEFQAKLLESIMQIPQNKKYVIFIPNSEDTSDIKSNLWITAIFIDKINTLKLNIDIVDIIYSNDYNYLQKIIIYQMLNIDFIMCDDGYYSGGQVTSNITKININKKYNPKYDYITIIYNILNNHKIYNGEIFNKIYCITPFISTYATKRIRELSPKIILLNTDKIETIEERCTKLDLNIPELINSKTHKPLILNIHKLDDIEIFEKLLNKYFPNLRENSQYNIIEGSMPFYFDHKIADYVSSFPTIYQFGIINIKIEDRDKKGCRGKNIKDHIIILNTCDGDGAFESLNSKNYTKQCLIPYYKKLRDLRIIEDS
jgi:hypothetical protein